MARDVVITGIGLASSLGEGVETHAQALASGTAPVIDNQSFAPYPLHPLKTLELDKQIPKKSDQRQMEPWQRLGVYAAGLGHRLHHQHARKDGVAGEMALEDRARLRNGAGDGDGVLRQLEHAVHHLEVFEPHGGVAPPSGRAVRRPRPWRRPAPRSAGPGCP